MTQNDYDILTNVIGAVETGGQVYGKRRYNVYTPPYTNSKLEHTITLGWAGYYGAEARRLVQMIYDADPATFKKIDTTGTIQAMLGKDWVSLRWNPSATQKAILIKLIDSEIGHKMQDALFQDEMKVYVAECEKTYTSDVPAVMMYCECRHLGGKKGADRIFKRCNGNYSLDSIMASIKKDQNDTSSNNQVGDKIFWSRHVKCREFIEKYVMGGKSTVAPKERAKILLRQQGLKNMTGYTPDASNCFKKANAWTTTPQKGYIVYFWGKPSGESNKRICHVGMVEYVNTSNKTFGTIEGNTSSSTWTTNGGVVARHTYSYASVGGNNRVNGFGIPDWKGAGVTPDQYVAMAQSYVGYEEKKSNAYLDDFHKNAGRNNYTKFQRDVVGYTGDQWCQFFQDALALYCCGGGSKGSDTNTVLKKGSTGEAVKTMQKMLITCGYDCGSAGADGDFGSGTEKALKEYQAAAKLDVDGQYGPKTKSALEAAYKSRTEVLKKGSKGESVKKLQEMLIALRYLEAGEADGDFGEKTDSALKTAQFSLLGEGQDDGEYGPKSRAAVEKAYKIATDKRFIYRDVNFAWSFDPEYYGNRYADLNEHYHGDEQKLFRHWIKWGIGEKRQAREDFNVVKYCENYPKLVDHYDGNLVKIVAHWCNYGWHEGRKGI